MARRIYCGEDGTYGGDAVGLAAVDNGSGLGAVGGVSSDNLSSDTRGDGANGTSNKSSDGETHFDIGWNGYRD